jgi:hypothetical protein
MTVAELKPFEDEIVTLHLRDGEIATAKIAYVDAEYQDIIVDVLSTNRPDLYKVPITNSAFTFPVSDVSFVQKSSR